MKPTPTVATLKGSDVFAVAEQIAISPQPKLGGDAGPLWRFLSISRGQSVITDLEQGSLATKHRVPGMPLMHRMWFHPEGYSLGYTKKQKIGNPTELYFLGPDAKLLGARDLPDAVSEVASDVGCWYVGCRNGTLYAFSLEGEHLWRQVIPCRPVASLSLTAEFTGETTQPYLHVRGGLGGVVVAESDRLYAFDAFGQRLLKSSVPHIDPVVEDAEAGEIPTREATLRRLGFHGDPDEQKVRTGYLRLAMDTNWNAGWLQQQAVYDIPDSCDLASPTSTEDEVVVSFQTCTRTEWITALAASVSRTTVGTQCGLVHVFDLNGSLLKTFHVGEANISQVLMDHDGVVAAYSGGRLMLFRGGEVSGTTTLPEYFVDLALCGEHVLAWRYQSAWVVDRSGRVIWAGNAERPIKAGWGHDGGFCLLAAGEVISFRYTNQTVRKKATRRKSR